MIFLKVTWPIRKRWAYDPYRCGHQTLNCIGLVSCVKTGCQFKACPKSKSTDEGKNNFWPYVIYDRMCKHPMVCYECKTHGPQVSTSCNTHWLQICWLTLKRHFDYRFDSYCIWYILFPPKYRTCGTFLSVIKSAAWDLCSHIFSSPFYFNTNMHLISHNTRPSFPKYSISRSSNFCLETICYANIMCKFTAYLWIFKGSVYMCKCTQYGSDGPWHEADIIDMY